MKNTNGKTFMLELEPDSRLTLRSEEEGDSEFLEALYGTTRADELARVHWSEEDIRRFISQQFHAQRVHYREHYPGAEFLLVEHDGESVGRLYVHQTRSELRLMDILLLPEWRGRGLGTRLLGEILQRASRDGLPVTLHVEPFNPARFWYERLGFETVEQRGVYLFMRLEGQRTRQAAEQLGAT